MNKLENIDWETIKTFIKGNTLLCALAAVDIFLFFAALGCDNKNDGLQEKISSLQIKENQIKANLGKLKGLEKDYETLETLKTDIIKKCLNFGKKAKVYNFLKQIDGFLPGNKINISNTNLYDITKGQTINFNQDLSEFDGDSILSIYNVLFSGKFEDLAAFLKQLDELPYCINLQKLEMRKNDTKGAVVSLNVNLSFALLGKIQLKDHNV